MLEMWFERFIDTAANATDAMQCATSALASV